MPWKETSVMDERMKFVGRLLTGEKMSHLCKEFGISRVTGYKIWDRYQEDGSRGLYNRSRAPHQHPNQIPFEIEQLIVRFKKEKPNWGAPKIRELVSSRYPTIKLPAVSTVHCVLDRHGLVNKKKRRDKYHATASYLSTPKEPNDLWCTDFKGQFRMGNHEYCYPLTLSDFVSRFVISCEALESTEINPCFAVFEETFQEYGLPIAIRSDNGTPFAGGNSIWNLTRLSVWWIRLGIRLERIKPGCPQQNGRHERMHRTLKLEATKPPASNLLQQQEKFDQFRDEFNFERPHQALDMKRPADVHKKSSREYRGLTDLVYPGYDKSLLISNCGRVCLKKQKIHISKAFANQLVGLNKVDDGIWQVDFMDYVLGYFDEENDKFAPREDPFGFKLDNWI
ncbi:MAG: IS481 family transposase [Proteobacteria bacterium]|nr:IS481 family transposase [Pseudomonadota bacterium]MBU1903752.1 IS481 family transposase [Pseudomonadota bacterium]